MEILKKISAKFFWIVRTHMMNLKAHIITALDKHVTKKKNWLRGKNESHITKPICQVIMKRSKLKNKAKRTKLLFVTRNNKKTVKLCSESKQ